MWHKFTTWVIKDPHFHCGIALWMTTRSGVPRLFICEAGIKRRVILLSSYLGSDMDVLKAPVDIGKYEEHMLSRVGVTPYSLWDYLSVALRIWLDVPVRCPFGNKGEICSEMVQKEYATAGYPTAHIVLSPGELYRLLLRDGCELRVRVEA